MAAIAASTQVRRLCSRVGSPGAPPRANLSQMATVQAWGSRPGACGGRNAPVGWVVRNPSLPLLLQVQAFFGKKAAAPAKKGTSKTAPKKAAPAAPKKKSGGGKISWYGESICGGGGGGGLRFHRRMQH